jgi:predicted acylesterase/phospholipase RssA
MSMVEGNVENATGQYHHDGAHGQAVTSGAIRRRWVAFITVTRGSGFAVFPAICLALALVAIGRLLEMRPPVGPNEYVDEVMRSSLRQIGRLRLAGIRFSFALGAVAAIFSVFVVTRRAVTFLTVIAGGAALTWSLARQDGAVAVFYGWIAAAAAGSIIACVSNPNTRRTVAATWFVVFACTRLFAHPVTAFSLACIAAIAAIIVRRLPAATAPTRRRSLLLVAAVICSVWVVVSLIDDTIAPIRKPVLRASTLQKRSPRMIGLALSGGGYRAAVYHAGVVYELKRIGVEPDVVSSVSGGSVFASMLVTGGTPEEFIGAVSAGRFNLKRRMANVANATRLMISARLFGSRYRLWPSDFSTTQVQAGLLDDLFLNRMRFSELNASRPKLLLCTTDVESGMMIGITPRGLIKRWLEPPAGRLPFANTGDRKYIGTPFWEWLPDEIGSERLSYLVAASGAFPGAFPPVRIFRKGEETTTRRRTVVVSLSDGGLADNLGLELLNASRTLAAAGDDNIFHNKETVMKAMADYRVDVIIASDGSAFVSRDRTETPLAEIGRAIDTVYLASGPSPMTPTPPTVLLSPLALNAGRFPKAHVPYDCGSSVRVDCISITTMPADARQLIESRMPHNSTARRPEDKVCASYLESIIQGAGQSTDPRLRYGCFMADATPEWLSDIGNVNSAKECISEIYEGALQPLLDAFARTSTLDDQIPPSDVESIFLLGRIVAAAQRGAICRLGS